MDVLYVGSGCSALKIRRLDTAGVQVCGANNAWRLLPDDGIWIHTGDFPQESRPKDFPAERRVSYDRYSESNKAVVEHLGCKTASPAHFLGYTIFFQGLYWIAWNFKPARIYLLGFDHDYAPEKVQRWENGGRPTPQNEFLKPRATTIKDWSEQFFDGLPQDFFYGHGTPDPMRLGPAHLAVLFDRAKELLPRLGVECINISGVTNGLNTFPHGEFLRS